MEKNANANSNLDPNPHQMYTLHVKKIDMYKKYNISLIYRSVIRIKNFINLKIIKEDKNKKKLFILKMIFKKFYPIYIYIYI